MNVPGHPKPTTTADRHHVVVEGRRWRATDPSIPDKLRRELVGELMSARRAVGAAKRSDDAEAETTARHRVHDAKVALGERGHPWWEPPTPAQLDARIRSAMRALLAHRGPGRSICPSDAARIVGGENWRAVMEAVHSSARTLARGGELMITARDQALSPDDELRGPIRFRPADRP